MNGVTVCLPLTQGFVTWVDWDDFDTKLRGTRWSAQCARGRVYALGRLDGSTAFLHRFILRPSNGQVVDHKNGDGLLNNRSNLRICTRRDNQRNQRKGRRGQSRFKGVRRTNWGWVAEIGYAGMALSLGTHETEKQAAVVYDCAAIRLFGGFACVNFPYPEMLAEGHASAIAA
jgi:hypothetical protein